MQRFIIAMALVALATACAQDSDVSVIGEAHAQAKNKPPPAPKGDSKAKPVPASSRPATLGVAPDFTLKDLDGKEWTLSKLRGKTVVLEWFNPGCPFVKYAHADGPLKEMAAKKSSDSVVWLAINSGAPGKQGHGVDVNKKAAKDWSMRHPVLMDESGKVGQAYGAKTTPHMYIIDKDGQLVYRGGLDNAPMGEAKGGGAIVNYVDQALAALAGGKPVLPAETTPYGCSVKYAN